MDCFEYIQLGRNFDKDYQTSQLRLDIARLRLTRWGETVEINQDDRFTQGDPPDEEARLAKRTLVHIYNLFEMASMESSRFKRKATENELALFDPNTNTNQAAVALRSSMRAIAAKRQDRISLSKKISWALYKKEKLDGLLESIHGFLDDLENLFPRREAYRRVAEIEVEEVGEPPRLQLLADAAQDDELLVEAVRRKLQTLDIGNSIEKANVTGNAMVRVGAGIYHAGGCRDEAAGIFESDRRTECWRQL